MRVRSSDVNNERRHNKDGDVGAMFETEVFGAGTGNQLVGEDYLPEEFIPASIRALSSGVTTASGVCGDTQ